MSDLPLHDIVGRIGRTTLCHALIRWARSGAEDPLIVRGAAGSLPAFLLHRLWQVTRRFTMCVLPEPEDAVYLHSDLSRIAGSSADLFLFPPSGQIPYNQEQDTRSEPLVRRADVLQQLTEQRCGVLVTSVPALVERTPSLGAVRQASRNIALGDTVAPQKLVEDLVRQDFERVRFVDQPGEVAWRGGIVDIYSFAGDYPIRIEFFGDDVDSLREFDPRSQRSISELRQARIAPRLEHFEASRTTWASLFDYLPADALMVLFDSQRHEPLATDLFTAASERYKQAEDKAPLVPPAKRYLDGARLQSLLMVRPRLYFGTFAEQPMTATTIDAGAWAQPAFNRQFKLLRAHLAENAETGTSTYILCESDNQIKRLKGLLDDAIQQGWVRLVGESLHQGFRLPSADLAVYTDHDIFGRYYRATTRRRKQHGGIRLHELRSLHPGDYVVHSDFGVGTFAGFRTITVRGKEQEAVRVHYAGGDVLYVNVNALYKLHKYTGKEGHQPKLTKLGSGQWERKKRRTKKRIKDIARDLIKLYAQRKASKGHPFSTDTVWQQEMEASFAFEDTPDQYSASHEVKRDMEAPAPMDRLVCGDVGFGKTEVAVRAAFKAVQDEKQVAVLVPTTVLARQHEATFAERLEHFPVRVEMLSRHRASKATRQILKDLKSGAVDILIGTHRIISKDVEFKDLGLLVVDEEQRFGVGVKERLRQMRVNIDTLTLTATPIPRTLQFSLMGARDLSIISTPPPNRQPIVTEIHSFDKGLIRDAILYELSRGGQVFFVHNRVRSIGEAADMIEALAPGARIQVAHGQMRAAEMERAMAAFVDRKADVLVSTTIIENGLDIANANTMIIHGAHRFGLAELHQLRGRVGRSHRRAFCYLLVPSIHALTREARQRLRAVEQLSNLGSGFQIAMRDLDIRGAGNVLGGEQSGFIADLGLSTYQQILDEAVQELRAAEFPALSNGEPPPPAATETQVDTELAASLPVSYVDSDLERLGLYRRISEIGAPEQLDDLRDELKDRFGPLPKEARNLLAAARMKMHAQKLGLPRVSYRRQRLFLHLPMDVPHFRKYVLQPLMERLDNTGHRYAMKPSKRGVPRAIVQQVLSMKVALALMQQLSDQAGRPATGSGD